jgi:hypothetical protein
MPASTQQQHLDGLHFLTATTSGANANLNYNLWKPIELEQVCCSLRTGEFLKLERSPGGRFECPNH